MKRFYILLIIFIGALLRLGYLIAPHIDSDQAIFALQSMHILKGEFPIFSWGYAYIGTFQSYLAAIFFLLFGPSREIFNFVAIFFYIGYAFSLYWLATAVFSKFSYRIMTLAIGCIAPNYFVIYGAWGRHGYPETYCFGSLMLAMICSSLYQHRGYFLYFILGFISGLAWWSNFLILYYFPAVGLFLIIQCSFEKNIKAISRILLGFGSGFFIGGFPFWLYNLQHNFSSFGIFHGGKKTILKGTINLINYFFPVLIGSREHGFRGTLSPIPATLSVIFGFLFLFFLTYRFIRFSQNTIKRKINAVDFIWLTMITMIAVFLNSSYNLIISSVRYLLPFYSLYPIIFIYTIKKVTEQANTKLKWSITLFLFTTVIIWNVYTVYTVSPVFQESNRKNHQAKMNYQRQLCTALTPTGQTQFLMYNYWEAPKFTFDAKEKFIFACPGSRYPQYIYNMVKEDVFNYLLSSNKSFENGISLLGYQFQKQKISGYPYTLYNNFKPINTIRYKTIPSDNYTLSSNINPFRISNLNDRNNNTHYKIKRGTDKDYQAIDVHFNQPTDVNGIALFLTNKKDMPITIEIIDPETNKLILSTKNHYLGYRIGPYPYLPPRPNYIELFFSSVQLRHMRIIFKEATVPVFKVDELLFFEKDTAVISKKNLFKELQQKTFETVHCSKGSIGPLQKELALPLKNADKGYINFKKKNLFVFHSDYLKTNQETLKEMKIPFESIEGTLFSAIITQKQPWKTAFWKDQLILSQTDRKKALSYYKKAIDTLTDTTKAESLFEKTIFFLPSHYNALIHLQEIYTKNNNTLKLADINNQLANFTPKIQSTTNFAGKINLEGISLSQQNLSKGKSFQITYFWKLLKTLKENKNLFIFVHFKDIKGNILFQNDHRLWDMTNSADRLIEGEMILDNQLITVPAHIAYTGPVEIWLGIWNPKKGKRWKIKTNMPHPPDNIKIGTINLK